MIVKIKSRKNQTYRQLLEYMLHDNDRLSGKEGFVVAHNLKGNRIDSWVDQFKALEAGRIHRRKNSVTMTHEILSWHADDARHMTKEKMERMTREYIRIRGVRGAKVLAIPHYNKSHYHVHLLVSGVDGTGKAMRLSRAEFGEIKTKAQQFQIDIFPELKNSVVVHSRKSQKHIHDKEVQYKKRTGKISTREELSEVVHLCRSRSHSKNDFFQFLKVAGIEVYLRRGKETGVRSGNRKFRFKNFGIDLEFGHINDLDMEVEKVRWHHRRGQGRHK